jgi:hypothetical protein
MKRCVVLGAVAMLAAGCAVGTPVTGLSLGGGEAPIMDAPAQTSEPLIRTAQAQAETKKDEGSFLGNIWDNFSSRFRTDEPEKPKETAPAEGEKRRRAIGKPAFDPKAALKLVNDYRKTKGLSPLALDPKAEKAASALAADMAKNDRMSHQGPNGADVSARLTSAGYAYKLAAENIGVGQASAEEMVEGWKKSPPHSKNMLLPKAKHAGFALEYNPKGKYQTYWVLVIAAR